MVKWELFIDANPYLAPIIFIAGAWIIAQTHSLIVLGGTYASRKLRKPQ